jgi:hypothetical protein
VGAKAGIPGVILGTLGYLLVPAIIGAIASAIFTGALRISRTEYEKGLEELAAEVQSHLPAASGERPLGR